MEDRRGVSLSISNLSKTFQGQRALEGLNLDLHKHEVHALLGQNGSGKSTLIKTLAGYHQPDSDHLATASMDGRHLELGSGAAARAAGIRFIHQDLGLIEQLTVIDNLALGGRYSKSLWLSDRAEHLAAQKLLASYHLDVDVTAPLSSLSPAQRSMLAIIRALNTGSEDPGLLVLDEPTAALPDKEVRQLFDLLAELRRRGSSILYVTHRLGEVFELADRVTVLRDGKHIATIEVKELDHDTLVELIIGRPMEAFYASPPVPQAEFVANFAGLKGAAVADVSLDIHRGEIVGIAGLVGSGYDELLGLAFGARHRAGGTVTINSVPIPANDPRAAIAAGVAYAAADRKRLSAIPEWTVRENVTLPLIPSVGWAKWLGVKAEQKQAAVWTKKLDVVPDDPERMFSSLSGGNQQKAVLARWLRCGASLILLDEPTNGVDTGAKQGIYASLSDAAKSGAGVVLASSDAEELCAICDRVFVMREGRVAMILQGNGLTVDRLISESMRAVDSNNKKVRSAHVG